MVSYSDATSLISFSRNVRINGAFQIQYDPANNLLINSGLYDYTLPSYSVIKSLIGATKSYGNGLFKIGYYDSASNATLTYNRNTLIGSSPTRYYYNTTGTNNMILEVDGKLGNGNSYILIDSDLTNVNNNAHVSIGANSGYTNKICSFIDSSGNPGVVAAYIQTNGVYI